MSRGVLLIASSHGRQLIVIRAPAGRNYGPEMNLFVGHSQLVQVECLRSGIGGTASVWGRVLTYRPDFAAKSERHSAARRKALPRIRREVVPQGALEGPPPGFARYRGLRRAA